MRAAMVSTVGDLAFFACQLASIDCSVMGLPWIFVLLLSTLWLVMVPVAVAATATIRAQVC